MHLQIDEIEKQIALLCLEFPEMYDDETLRADMLEGQTDAFAVLALLTERIREEESLEAAIAFRLSDLKVRKERGARRGEGYRTLALRIMHAAHLNKVTLPEATLSIRTVAPKVEVDDVDLFLQAYPKYQRIKAELDRTMLKADLAAGIACVGARLGNGSETLTLSTK